ncbi:MAG: response regulator [Anaerolineae bacterium]|nr:response regulator [Anaerolineae bacterium]
MLKNKNILIVEDDPDGRDMVQMMLQSAGVHPVAVGSGEEALAELRAAPGHYQLAIVDLALPEMDGIELLSHIRADASLAQIPLVAVTAYHTPELKVRVMDAGFDSYFAKPLDTTQLVRALERLLN